MAIGDISLYERYFEKDEVELMCGDQGKDVIITSLEEGESNESVGHYTLIATLHHARYLTTTFSMKLKKCLYIDNNRVSSSIY